MVTPVNMISPFLEFVCVACLGVVTLGMANQRKAGKKKVGFWVDETEKAAMMKAMKAAGYDNLADWLRSLITGDESNKSNKPPRG